MSTMHKASRVAAVTALALTLALSAVALLHVGVESASPPTPSSDTLSASACYIVQLTDPPLATYAGGLGGLSPTAPAKTGATHLDLSQAASLAYASYLQGHQAAVETALRDAAPGAVVERRYGVVFNGLAVHMAEADVARVRTLAGVKAVLPVRAYHLDLDVSVPLIGAPHLWQQLGGADQAARGVKVAVVDTGIYISNTFFNAAGFAYPPGFPKGDARYTTPKVIAARAYFRPSDPPAPGHETPLPGPSFFNEFSHGSHVAGTIAGRANTVVTLQGELAASRGITHTLSGVAPGAWLMNYKVFYKPQNGSGASAYTPEILAALDDAVADGADIVSNSWGADAVSAGWADPIVQAVEAAVDAGVVMVFAAGNEGPDKGTIDTPAVSSKVISVGASTTDVSVTYPRGKLDVVAPTPVTTDVIGIAWEPSVRIGPPITGKLGPLPYVWAGDVTTDGQPEGCNLDGAPNPFPNASLTGKIVLIRRGTCAAYDKVRNAQASGAVAVVIYERQPRGRLPSVCYADCDQVTIPMVAVDQTDGEALLAWYRRYPTTAQLQIDATSFVQSVPRDGIIYFSSRGPSADLRLKPDVVAPGFYILSAGYGYPSAFEGFGQASGTSMATPHVAGAAALLRQLHPTWSPAAIKSALMTTAKVEGLNPQGEAPYGDLVEHDPTVLDFGAGRIDLTKAGDPGVILDPPSLWFAPHQGLYSTQMVTVTNVADREETYTVTVSQTEQLDSGFVLQPGPTQITLKPGESQRIPVTLGIAPDAALGDYAGLIWLRGTDHTAHVPYWLRVLPAQARTDVLLVDNDGSDQPGPDRPRDYVGVYTRTLESLGLSYTVFNADMAHLSSRFSIGDLLQYKTVLWFTGDNAAQSSERQTEADQMRLRDYLNSGGRLLVSGQNVAVVSQLDSGVGNTLLYGGYLGAKYISDDVFEGALRGLPPRPSIAAASGASFLNGVRLDLSTPVTTTAGAGAGNQLSVDEIGMTADFDILNLGYGRVAPLFSALGGRPARTGIVGLSVSSEPSLEEPRQALAYRTAYLSFGIEGINDNTGYATKADVMSKLLSWLTDEARVSVTGPTTATIGTPISLVASGRSSASDATFTRYRWDFGDGTPVQDTLIPSVLHPYVRPRTYTVRVEATDSYGHQAIAALEVHVSAPATVRKWRVYLPMLRGASASDHDSGFGK